MDEYYIQDARHLDDVIGVGQVDVIITSPPYFDLKDYGSDNQIGYGQKYDDYMQDMRRVLHQCYEVTKQTGSMWVVVDTLKKNGNFKLLPFEISREAEKSGWILQDIIIWKKDRTLPFSRKGEMRNIFEYILYFVKSKTDFKYYPDRISSLDIKEWWIKYPERYSLRGKAMADVWDFPIPIQGSWGDSYVRHFCPLPAQMIDQIIQLCSDEGDVIFDPFAGTGAVLAEAHRLKRTYIGCDLNPEYRSMFYTYLEKIEKREQLNDDDLKLLLGSTLMKLRTLKWASALLKSIRKLGGDSIDKIRGVVIEANLETPGMKPSVEYKFIISPEDSELEVIIEKLASKAPFTKYGIRPVLSFNQEMHSAPKWSYQWNSTYTDPKPYSEAEKQPFIASDLNLTTDERRLVNNYKKTGKLTLGRRKS